MRRGLLKRFNPTAYTATIRPAGSRRVYLEAIAVAQNLLEAQMGLGRKVAIIFFDEHNAKEAVVAAVYTWGLNLCIRRFLPLVLSSHLETSP